MIICLQDLTRPDEAPYDRTPDKKNELMRQLDKVPYQDQKNRIPDRTLGTCSWFLDHPIFQEWQWDPLSPLLWVTADPGCGKSVLAKFLIDDTLKSFQSRIVCYFFFDGKSSEQQSITNALCSVLHQLFQQEEDLLSDAILQDYLRHANFTSSVTQLWNTLITAAESLINKEVVCVFDAIDECEQHGRKRLIEEVCRFFNRNERGPLKFLLTSRPWGEIRHEIESQIGDHLPSIHLQGDADTVVQSISVDIAQVIGKRVRGISKRLRFNEEEEEALLHGFTKGKPHRTYLWTKLILDMVERNPDITKSQIEQMTSELPQPVQKAYERMLYEIPDPDRANGILHIILAATRPLSVDEMRHALNVIDGHHHSSHNLELKTKAWFCERVRELCGLFLTIVDDHIDILHESGRMFLEQRFSVQDAHRTLAEACIRHLLFFEDSDIEAPFVEYSVRNWTMHAQKADFEAGHEIIPSMLRLCDPRAKWLCLLRFHSHTNIAIPEDGNSLMVASCFGLTMVVNLLLNQKPPPSARDKTYGRTALSWAAGNGFDETIQLFLPSMVCHLWRPFSTFPSIELSDHENRTPLMHAVLNDHVLVAKRLLDAGASTNATDKYGMSAAEYITYSTSDEMRGLLSIQSKSFVTRNTPWKLSNSGRICRAWYTSFSSALVQHVGMMKLRSSPHTQDRLQTAAWAVRNGHDDIFNLLLTR
ncbi:hypothetical protein ASPZODRAFT_1258257 [Penicilliopsis zonata CBS 506.65]|uniref:Nephrocystin 3-like N-terminal domain-containing protein n=1 Tax=Penicilliopsis zonata CBS 506.65 TaxID=1073090 RepID=A0A1L9S6P0_9EURO|nr:hypothetical protein ASPZODRAFT_1258257 [Penicilliopsis zonata CBS 506.65]OJJ42793.1 hypothetical protein ASPZODRAFT_1258257 [Penicilliopsis zonata CBS 506.65]